MASDANDLSPYELARLERIRRNEDRLRGLGLIGGKPEHVTSSVGPKKVQRVRKEKRASIPTRSSKRLRELTDGKQRSHEGVAEDNGPGGEEVTVSALKDKVNYVSMPHDTEELDDYEFQVYAALRSWRLLRKNELEVEPYKICQNRTLCELIRRRRNDIGFAPRQGSEENARTVEQDLLSVWGIGPSKATQGGFGWEMLEVLDSDENSRLLELSRVRSNGEQKSPSDLRLRGICRRQSSTAIKTIIIATVVSALHGVVAFTPRLNRNSFIPPSESRRTGTITSLQCICINCARVTNCSAYHFVEEQHSQPHINKSPTWEPRNGSPTIQVHIRPDVDRNVEKSLGQMWTEHEDQTRQAEEALNKSKEVGEENVPLFGEKQYDLSGTTSYEYDVIECEDFVLSKDAWVRNMPEEIRKANPNFVPT